LCGHFFLRSQGGASGRSSRTRGVFFMLVIPFQAPNQRDCNAFGAK
jgi:hypothetical protein